MVSATLDICPPQPLDPLDPPRRPHRDSPRSAAALQGLAEGRAAALGPTPGLRDGALVRRDRRRGGAPGGAPGVVPLVVAPWWRSVEVIHELQEEMAMILSLVFIACSSMV